MRFTMAQLCVVTNALAQQNVAAMDSDHLDGLAQDLMALGLIALTAAHAHEPTIGVPRSSWGEWGMSLLALKLGEET